MTDPTPLDLDAIERRMNELAGIAIGGVNLDAPTTIGVVDDLRALLAECRRLRSYDKFIPELAEVERDFNVRMNALHATNEVLLIRAERAEAAARELRARLLLSQRCLEDAKTLKATAWLDAGEKRDGQ